MLSTDRDDEDSTSGERSDARRLTLTEATQLILGDNHGLADPERWVAKQLRAGRFRGQKIGRAWFMCGGDIEAAIEAMYNVPRTASLPDDPPPQPDPPIAPDNAPDVLGGLSARSRRRIIHPRRGW